MKVDLSSLNRKGGRISRSPRQGFAMWGMYKKLVDVVKKDQTGRLKKRFSDDKKSENRHSL